MADGEGQIITFYSYKGGTGRTMALANTAWVLAANGKRVLVVDWDLESPGLHKFFHPFLDDEVIASTPGSSTSSTTTSGRPSAPSSGPPTGTSTTPSGAARRVPGMGLPGEGTLDFISAGQQNRDYSSLGVHASTGTTSTTGSVAAVLRRHARRHEGQLRLRPDRQPDRPQRHRRHLHAAPARRPGRLLHRWPTRASRAPPRWPATSRNGSVTRPIRILPVPMRIDDGEKEKLDAGRPAGPEPVRQPAREDDAPEERNRYWGAVEIPYKRFYAFEETLATFGDASGSPTSLLAAYERLTGAITEGTGDRAASDGRDPPHPLARRLHPPPRRRPGRRPAELCARRPDVGRLDQVGAGAHGLPGSCRKALVRAGPSWPSSRTCRSWRCCHRRTCGSSRGPRRPAPDVRPAEPAVADRAAGGRGARSSRPSAISRRSTCSA